MTEPRHLEFLLPELLTLILQELSPKKIVHFALTTSKSIKTRCSKVHWNVLLQKYYWMVFINMAKPKVGNFPFLTDCEADIVKSQSNWIRFYKSVLYDEENVHCIPESGVCDSVQQLAEKYPLYNGIIYASVVYREQTRNAVREGWRWHKWGEYVGDYDLSNIEYLDEADGQNGRPLIDSQIVFNRHRLRSNVCGLADQRAPRYKLYLGVAIYLSHSESK